MRRGESFGVRPLTTLKKLSMVFVLSFVKMSCVVGLSSERLVGRFRPDLRRPFSGAGDAAANPFVPRSGPLPMPPLRPTVTSELFRKATEAMGLHPYPTPVAVNSQPYHGFPATRYCAWSGGFGPFEIFEDVDLALRLRRAGRIEVLDDAALAISARRCGAAARV